MTRDEALKAVEEYVFNSVDYSQVSWVKSLTPEPTEQYTAALDALDYLKSEAAGELVRVEDVRQWLEKFMGECIQGGLSLGEAFLYLDQQIKHLPRYPGVDAERRLQAAEKLADAVEEYADQFMHDGVIKACADYRAATKEGK